MVLLFVHSFLVSCPSRPHFIITFSIASLHSRPLLPLSLSLMFPLLSVARIVSFPLSHSPFSSSSFFFFTLPLLLIPPRLPVCLSAWFLAYANGVELICVTDRAALLVLSSPHTSLCCPSSLSGFTGTFIISTHYNIPSRTTEVTYSCKLCQGNHNIILGGDSCVVNCPGITSFKVAKTTGL